MIQERGRCDDQGLTATLYPPASAPQLGGSGSAASDDGLALGCSTSAVLGEAAGKRSAPGRPVLGLPVAANATQAAAIASERATSSGRRYALYVPTTKGSSLEWHTWVVHAGSVSVALRTDDSVLKRYDHARTVALPPARADASRSVGQR